MNEKKRSHTQSEPGEVTVQTDEVQERKQLIASLQMRVSQQTAIATLGQQALTGMDISALLNAAVTLVADTLKVEYVKVLEQLPDSKTLLLQAGVGWQEGWVGHATVDAGIYSQAGYTLLSQEPVILEDLRTESRFADLPLLCNHGIISGMSVIIAGLSSTRGREEELGNWGAGETGRQGKDLVRNVGKQSPLSSPPPNPFGVLGVHTQQRRTFTQDDINFLQAIANILAEAIERSNREKVLHKQAQLLNLANDAIIVRDFEGWISYWNQGAQRLYGWTAQEAIGQKSHTLLQTEFPQALTDIQAELLQHGIWQGELIHRKQDGTTITVTSRWTLQPDEQGNSSIILVINRDITQLKQAEQQREQLLVQLEQERGFLEAVLQQMPAGVIIAEADSHTLLLSNEQVAQIWREPVQIASTIEEYAQYQGFYPDGRPYRFEDWPLIRALTTGETITNEEIDYLRGDGTQGMMYVSAAPVRNREGQIIAGVTLFQDITEHKQMEAALRDREEQFRATVEQAAVGVAHVAPDGRWLLVNQKLCDLVEYSRSELLERTFQDITHPDDLAADLALVHQLLRGEISSYSIEKRYISASGLPIWIDLSVSIVREETGEPKYFISVIQDINHRKQLEVALRQSIQRLENLYELDRAILAAQSPQHTTQRALERLSQLLPCSRLSVVVFDLEHQQATILATYSDRDTQIQAGTSICLQPFTKAIAQLRQGEIYQGLEIETLPLSEPLVQAFQAEELSCFVGFPLIAKGELIGALNLWGISITSLSAEQMAIAQEVATQLAIALQQYRLQQQLLNYTSELEQHVAERTAKLQDINAELESFSYTVSHDLRAPLRAMQGFANALQEDCAQQLGELGQNYSQRIVAAAQRMDKMIQDLLAYSRISRAELHLQPVSLEWVIAEVLAQLNSEIEDTQAQITVGAKGLSPLPKVLGHRSTLIQIVGNLLSNALKFVPNPVQPQVQIWVEEVERRGEDRGESVTSAQQILAPYDRTQENLLLPQKDSISSTKWIRLWVEDNGIGIKSEYQERIFKVFERLHGQETYPGSGIGLAIVRKGMERMGGYSGVESSMGQGSRFWLEVLKASSEAGDSMASGSTQ